MAFAPKYRRKEFFEYKRLEVGAILRELCNWKEVNIFEAEVFPLRENPQLGLLFFKVTDAL
jgi:Transposase and inactivated derivatives